MENNMKYVTRIVKKNYDNSVVHTLYKTLDGILYEPILNQTIKLMADDGTHLELLVVGIQDSIYEDIIYRYIETISIK
ncbi:MAG: hypothetical protein ACRCX8_08745 [Sarcina sp.]